MHTLRSPHTRALLNLRWDEDDSLSLHIEIQDIFRTGSSAARTSPHEDVCCWNGLIGKIFITQKSPHRLSEHNFYFIFVCLCLCVCLCVSMSVCLCFFSVCMSLCLVCVCAVCICVSFCDCLPKSSRFFVWLKTLSVKNLHFGCPWLVIFWRVGCSN